MPLVAGEIVYVASAASATATEKHYGGGYFQSFDNSTSQIADDGGIVIVPSTGTLAWHRINFTAYDMQFWGLSLMVRRITQKPLRRRRSMQKLIMLNLYSLLVM